MNKFILVLLMIVMISACSPIEPENFSVKTRIIQINPSEVKLTIFNESSSSITLDSASFSQMISETTELENLEDKELIGSWEIGSLQIGLDDIIVIDANETFELPIHLTELIEASEITFTLTFSMNEKSHIVIVDSKTQ